MAYRQKYNPRVTIGASRGWCLKYIDDAGSAPKRTPNAATALRNERNAKRLKTSTPPVGLWVVGFLDLRSGSFAADDHVFFMKYKGNGKYEIRDSETQAGARSVYNSIGSITSWFGNYSPKYVGWSTHCDGRQYVEEYTPKPSKPAAPKRVSKRGSAKVVVTALNVRDKYSTAGKVVATYKKGDRFNYDSYVKSGGYTWLSYVSWSGKRRYVAQGKDKTKYVSGGV